MKIIDSFIQKLYRNRWGLKLPLYLGYGKYVLSFYAQDCDWKSMRIKIMRYDNFDWKIKYVIKRGIY